MCQMKETTLLPSLPPRPPDAHKGTFGSVLVVGGSREMSGAAALAGLAALRAGAGLATVAVPAGVQGVVAGRATCCLTAALPDTRSGALRPSALAQVLLLAGQNTAMALGTGMGRHPATMHFVREAVRKAPLPLVVDADGLNALAEDLSALHGAPAPRILTPHPGEMARLCGLVSAADVQRDRLGLASRFARQSGCVVVLKGRGTVVADGERCFVNSTGNPGMATGGSGDVLTGVVAALLAQGLPPFDAAALGAYVHGLAGDLAADETGQVSLMAEDILDALPRAFRQMAL